MSAALLGFSALLAAVLAGVGLYGVLSYSVGRRRGELGIRMALGAQTGDLRRMVVRHGMVLVLLGAVLGLADEGLAYALCGGLAANIYGADRFTVDIDLLIAPDDLDRALTVARRCFGKADRDEARGGSTDRSAGYRAAELTPELVTKRLDRLSEIRRLAAWLSRLRSPAHAAQIPDAVAQADRARDS